MAVKFEGEQIKCQECGSARIETDGYDYMNSKKRRVIYHCRKCNRRFVFGVPAAWEDVPQEGDHA